MTLEEYLEFVNAPADGGRTIGEILGIDLSGIVPSNILGRLGSAAAGMAGSALAGTGGGLIGSGIYDAVALRNQAQDISNRQGFTPQLSFWDYLMAALPFVSPESRIRNADWRPDPSESPEPSEEDYARMGQGDWWDMVNDQARNTPRPEDRIDVESLPPLSVGQIAAAQEIGTDISTSIPSGMPTEDVGSQFGPGIRVENLPPPPGYSEAPPLAPPQFTGPASPTTTDIMGSFNDPTIQTPYTTDIGNFGPFAPIQEPVNPEWLEMVNQLQSYQNEQNFGPQETAPPGSDSLNSSSLDGITQSYEDQYGDYGGWYGAKGGPVSAFQEGGAVDFGQRLEQLMQPDRTNPGLSPQSPKRDPEKDYPTNIVVAPPIIAEFYKNAQEKQEAGKKLTSLEQEILTNYFEFGKKVVGLGPGMSEKFYEDFYRPSMENYAGPHFMLEEHMAGKGPYSSKMGSFMPEEFGFKVPEEERDEFGEPKYQAPWPRHSFQGGGMVRGPGSGMDDMVPATIEGRQMAKLSNDEFVIPADVVSDLGDGSSNAGHKKLYQFISDIRQAKTGDSSQPPKLMSALRGLNENARGKRSTFISDVINMKKAINAGDNEDRSYAAEYIRAIKSVMEAA